MNESLWSKFKPVPRGARMKEVVTRDWVQTVQDALQALANGDHLTCGANLKKGIGLGRLMLDVEMPPRAYGGGSDIWRPFWPTLREREGGGGWEVTVSLGYIIERYVRDMSSDENNDAIGYHAPVNIVTPENGEYVPTSFPVDIDDAVYVKCPVTVYGEVYAPELIIEIAPDWGNEGAPESVHWMPRESDDSLDLEGTFYYKLAAVVQDPDSDTPKPKLEMLMAGENISHWRELDLLQNMGTGEKSYIGYSHELGKHKLRTLNEDWRGQLRVMLNNDEETGLEKVGDGLVIFFRGNSNEAVVTFNEEGGSTEGEKLTYSDGLLKDGAVIHDMENPPLSDPNDPDSPPMEPRAVNVTMPHVKHIEDDPNGEPPVAHQITVEDDNNSAFNGGRTYTVKGNGHRGKLTIEKPSSSDEVIEWEDGLIKTTGEFTVTEGLGSGGTGLPEGTEGAILRYTDDAWTLVETEWLEVYICIGGTPTLRKILAEVVPPPPPP